MTDRVQAFTVFLEDDIRDDDALDIGRLLLQIKGVSAVKNVLTVSDDCLARNRVSLEYRRKINALLDADL